MSSQSPDPLLSLRTALLLLLALVIGIAAGVLNYLSTHDLPASVLVGGGAASAALLLFHTVVGS